MATRKQDSSEAATVDRARILIEVITAFGVGLGTTKVVDYIDTSTKGTVLTVNWTLALAVIFAAISVVTALTFLTRVIAFQGAMRELDAAESAIDKGLATAARIAHLASSQAERASLGS